MMASNYATFAAFALVCALILTLPFIPAFLEWRRPSDVASLPVSANYTSDIDHFSKRLHADAMARLGDGPSTGFEDFDFVDFPVENMDWQKSDKRLIARESIETASAIKASNGTPLYVRGDVLAGPSSSFSALYTTGDVALGSNSEVRDWAHADGVLRLGANSTALRRISAGAAIELGREVWFERLHAPTVRFGLGIWQSANKRRYAQTPASYAALPNAVQQTPSLFLIRGDCALQAGQSYNGSLVVTGFLTIGEGTTIVGDVKARDGVSLGRWASVEGAITCEKRIYVFKDARALGPVVSESDILIGAGAYIGLPDALTTVTAQNIIVEEGATVHGSVWAHEVGMVKSA